MKFSKVHLFTALPLIFALSGCATTEENATPVAEAPAATAAESPAVAAPQASAAPEIVKPQKCDKHPAALDTMKHDCVEHCKKAKGKKGKACIKHCEHEALSKHDCKAHCADQANSNDPACAKHCSDAASHGAHCGHPAGCSGDVCSKHADNAHQCTKQHCAKHGGAMDACCGAEHNCEQHCAKNPGSNDPACVKHCQDPKNHSAQCSTGHCDHHG